MKETHYFTCEICGQNWNTAEEALKCESLGKPKILLKLNDEIYYKCDYKPNEDDPFSRCTYTKNICNLFDVKVKRFNDGSVRKLYVHGIEIYGHDANYILNGFKLKKKEIKEALKNKSDCCMGFINGSYICYNDEYGTLRHPVICQDKMKEILLKQQELKDEYEKLQDFYNPEFTPNKHKDDILTALVPEDGVGGYFSDCKYIEQEIKILNVEDNPYDTYMAVETNRLIHWKNWSDKNDKTFCINIKDKEKYKNINFDKIYHKFNSNMEVLKP